MVVQDQLMKVCNTMNLPNVYICMVNKRCTYHDGMQVVIDTDEGKGTVSLYLQIFSIIVPLSSECL